MKLLFILCNRCTELAHQSSAWIVENRGCTCIFLPEVETKTVITLRPQELKPGCVPLNSNTIKHLRVGKGEDE